MITVRRFEACMGGAVEGVDLGRPMTDELFGDIRQALHTHHVLKIPAQSIAPKQLLTFARRFGQPEPHVLNQFHHSEYPEILILSNVVKEGKPIGLADGGTYWHTDYSYLEVPARATLLYSVQVPSVGGNTLFADQACAYAELSEAMKRRIEGLVGLHVYGNREDLNPESRTKAYPLSNDQIRDRNITVIKHPLVRRHPYTGQRALYAVSGTSIGIDGMPQDEALALLRELTAFSTQPKYQLSVDYGVGDLVVWDNALVLHSATLTDPKYGRTLLRVTTKEATRPV